jgi:hypothetical protein
MAMRRGEIAARHKRPAHLSPLEIFARTCQEVNGFDFQTAFAARAAGVPRFFMLGL